MTRTLLCCFFDIFFPFVARDLSPSLREDPFSVFNQHDIPFPCGQQNKPRFSLRESTKRSRSAHSLYGDKRGLSCKLPLTGGKTPRTFRTSPCSASLRRRRTERGGRTLWPFLYSVLPGRIRLLLFCSGTDPDEAGVPVQSADARPAPVTNRISKDIIHQKAVRVKGKGAQTLTVFRAPPLPDLVQTLYGRLRTALRSGPRLR